MLERLKGDDDLRVVLFVGSLSRSKKRKDWYYLFGFRTGAVVLGRFGGVEAVPN